MGAALCVLLAARAWERKRAPLTLAALFFCSLALGLHAYAWLIEPRTLVLRETIVETPHWRGAPLRLAVIADTHVGSPHVNAARIERLVARVNAARPDLVLLLGDYTGGNGVGRPPDAETARDIALGVAAFALLEAPLGTVAVLGNHDVWWDAPAVTRALIEAGAPPLWNRHVVIDRGGAPFVVAGLADADTGEPNLSEALDGAPEGLDVIVLTHSPDPFAQMAGPIALTVAGHTHCGQVTIPLIGRPLVPSAYGARYACGRVEEGGRVMIVSAGIGSSILPVRFLNPPEVNLITLRAVGPS